MISHSPSSLLRVVAALVALVLTTGCAIVPARVSVQLAEIAEMAGEPLTTQPDTTTAPDSTARLVQPRPRRGRFQMDLYQRNDHVPQYNRSWCVGASMQMMMNLMERGEPNRSKRTQKDLYDLAREISPWVETRPGASVYGWAVGLGEEGYGTFLEMSSESRAEALRMAARQMRFTRKPVGLLVWDGAHAWVMSGFKATADPAYTNDFDVTAVWIEDPWHGRVSRTWGKGLEPHTLVSARELRADFVKWSSRYRPEYGRDGAFVIVAPLEDGAIASEVSTDTSLVPAALIRAGSLIRSGSLIRAGRVIRCRPRRSLPAAWTKPPDP